MRVWRNLRRLLFIRNEREVAPWTEGSFVGVVSALRWHWPQGLSSGVRPTEPWLWPSAVRDEHDVLRVPHDDEDVDQSRDREPEMQVRLAAHLVELGRSAGSSWCRPVHPEQQVLPEQQVRRDPSVRLGPQASSARTTIS